MECGTDFKLLITKITTQITNRKKINKNTQNKRKKIQYSVITELIDKEPVPPTNR